MIRKHNTPILENITNKHLKLRDTDFAVWIDMDILHYQKIQFKEFSQFQKPINTENFSQSPYIRARNPTKFVRRGSVARWSKKKTNLPA